MKTTRLAHRLMLSIRKRNETLRMLARENPAAFKAWVQLQDAKRSRGDGK